ncbi:MAG TPA: hypothetical protein VH330_11915 [Candidatus Udaeobacter sp.]
MKTITAVGSAQDTRAAFTKVSLFKNLLLISIISVACSIDCGAGEPDAAFSIGKRPLIPIGKPNQKNIQKNVAGPGSGKMMPLRSINGQTDARRPSRRIGDALNLTHGRVNPDAPGQNTIPHWSDSFTYNGLVYNYTMVGTDPERGSATTVIPTVLIPLRFVFADGNVFDATTDIVNGQTPVQGIINSPIFQNYNFNRVGVNVGNTQWGDALQRANFWDSVRTRSPNYHVLLGQPRVLPVQTVNVPYGSFSYYIDPVFGPQPEVDDQFLFDLVNPVLTTANISPGSLPIIVAGQITGYGAFAFHGVTSLNGNGVQTFIETCYFPGSSGDSGIFAQDIYPLSHEVAEWINDPFNNNFTPGWDFPFSSPPDVRCDSGNVTRDLLEVADPMEFYFESDVALPSATYAYHVTEVVFIDFFTRAHRSRSYNGQYSLFEIGLPFGNVTQPSAPCTGHVEFTPTYVDFPGATLTVVTGMNNPGLAVGFYDDSAGAEHGFTFDGRHYSRLDYPGSILTDALKINDAGMIVGTFVDASGGEHGFSYRRGQWRQIDFPGASDTEAYGINAAGDIVGVYDGFQPVTHGFVLRNGQYQRIDTPFGTQSETFGINDLGSITGLGYTDPNGASTSFVLSHNRFSTFQFPGSIFTELFSINDSNDLAGFFEDPDGTYWGMVTVFGNPYQVYYASIWGYDSFDRILGEAYDETGRLRGLIGTLPLEQNCH